MINVTWRPFSRLAITRRIQAGVHGRQGETAQQVQATAMKILRQHHQQRWEDQPRQQGPQGSAGFRGIRRGMRSRLT